MNEGAGPAAEQSSLSSDELGRIVEAVLLASDQPLSFERLQAVFDTDAAPSRAQLREALDWIAAQRAESSTELTEVASGWRLQVREAYAPWVARLWREKPQRYSRALLETLAIICYRQPITRGEIEEIRGVSLSANIVRTLLERGWIREVGHREVPGRPVLLGTTRQFLDDYNLNSLDQLPALPEIKDLDALHAALARLDPQGEASAEPDENGTADETGEDQRQVSGGDDADADPGDAPDGPTRLPT